MSKYLVKIEIVKNNIFSRIFSAIFGPVHCRKIESEFDEDEILTMVKTKIEELCDDGLIK